MKFLVFCLLVAGTTAVNVNYIPCTYKGNGPVNTATSINIDPLPADGCDYTEPGNTARKFCKFTSEATYNGTITFQAGETSNTATSKAFGQLFSLGRQEFKVTPPNACTNGVQCPIMAGTDVVYKASVTVPKFTAGIKGLAEWQVIGDNDKALFCFVFPFIIVGS